MSVTSSSDLIQIIDEHGKFASTPVVPTLHDYIASHEQFLSSGHTYSIVSIIGPQSSGKSTLMNRLFGTNFQVLDARGGLGRTTRGVWMGIAKEAPEEFKERVVVLDVEGNDSSEREDDLNFERKSNLFTLALSSVFIINIWAEEVGRYNATNLSLLKTIFELNLQLFIKEKTKNKPLLIFLFRDHSPRDLNNNATTPRNNDTLAALDFIPDKSHPSLDRMALIFNEELEQTWLKTQKPRDFENALLRDFFEITFLSLPHKILKPQLFEEEVSKLKQKFFAEFLTTKYNRSDIPADGFCQFSTNIWDIINSNKDLDLPKQKEILSAFRCDTIAQNCTQLFTEKLTLIRNNLSKDLNHYYLSDENDVSLGEEFDEILNKIENEYRQATINYDEKIRDEKYAILIERIFNEIIIVVTTQLVHIQTKLISEFDEALSVIFAEKNAAMKSLFERLVKSFNQKKTNKEIESVSDEKNELIEIEPENDITSLNIGKELEKSFNQFFAKWKLKTFKTNPKSINVLENSPTGSSSDKSNVKSSEISVKLSNNAMKETLHQHFLNVKKQIIALYIKQISIYLDKTIVNSISTAFGSGDVQSTWLNVRTCYSSSMKMLSQVFVEKGLKDGFCVDDVSVYESQIQGVFRLKVFAKAKEKANFINFRMKKAFDRLFLHNTDGSLRHWSSTDNIGQLFLNARMESQKLLNVFCYFRLNDEDDAVNFYETTVEIIVENGIEEKFQQMLMLETPYSPLYRKDNVLIEYDARCQILQDFTRETELMYVQALRDQERVSSTVQVPFIFFVLCCIFGFNEFRWILKRPLYLLFLLAIICPIVILYRLGTPIQRLVNYIGNITLSNARDFLVDILTPKQKKKFTQDMIPRLHIKTSMANESNVRDLVRSVSAKTKEPGEHTLVKRNTKTTLKKRRPSMDKIVHWEETKKDI